MSADDHGTRSTYINYRCRCDACRRANSDYQLRSIARRRAERFDVSHGSYSTYVNYGCRCAECRDAARACQRARRERMRSAS